MTYLPQDQVVIETRKIEVDGVQYLAEINESGIQRSGGCDSRYRWAFIQPIVDQRMMRVVKALADRHPDYDPVPIDGAPGRWSAGCRKCRDDQNPEDLSEEVETKFEDALGLPHERNNVILSSTLIVGEPHDSQAGRQTRPKASASRILCYCPIHGSAVISRSECEL